MVKTTFRITNSGVPILSAAMIENTAEQMLEEFLPQGCAKPCAIDMDAFLIDYFHMVLEEKSLSHDGHILGMTVFADTDKVVIYIPEKNEADYYSVKARTVLIDRKRQTSESVRFTKAHEAGHSYFHNVFFMRHPGEKVCRESRETLEQKDPDKDKVWSDKEWMEWQANTFASCLLMPAPMVRKLIDPMPKIQAGDPFGDRMERICRVCDVFQVSKAMAEIRLKGLGLLEDEAEPGYIFRGSDGYVVPVGSGSLYYDDLGNYIPERPVDPPDPVEVQAVKKKKNKKK